jgi:hypothetical protein
MGCGPIASPRHAGQGKHRPYNQGDDHKPSCPYRQISSFFGLARLDVSGADKVYPGVAKMLRAPCRFIRQEAELAASFALEECTACGVLHVLII